MLDSIRVHATFCILSIAFISIYSFSTLCFTPPSSVRLPNNLQVTRDHDELLGSSRGFRSRQVSSSSRTRLPMQGGQKVQGRKQILKKLDFATGSMSG